MKTRLSKLTLAFTLAAGAHALLGATVKKPPAHPAAATAIPPGAVKADFALPEKCYSTTPRQVKNTTAPKLTNERRKPVYLPKGARVVSKGMKVTSSDDSPIIGELSKVTDGVKDGTEGNWVELGPGTQWVQIDLGKPTTVYGSLLWHYHAEARVYRDVVLQVSNDADFTAGVTTVYNNDQDNSSGLGAGKQREFYENFQGQWIAFDKPQKARYIRFYSRGNTTDPQNQYIEAEVWGDPSKIVWQKLAGHTPIEIGGCVYEVRLRGLGVQPTKVDFVIPDLDFNRGA